MLPFRERIDLHDATKHSTIYLIANNALLTDRHFTKLKISNDICIHFNKAIHIDKTPNSNNQLMLNNYEKNDGGYHGFEEYRQSHSKFTKLFLNTHQDQIVRPSFKNLINEACHQNETDVVNAKKIHYGFFKQTLPSIGAICLYLVVTNYHKTHKIVTVGYTGSFDDGTVSYGIKTGSGHPWKNEREFVKMLRNEYQLTTFYSTLAEIKALR